jgi:hypothetical protein
MSNWKGHIRKGFTFTPDRWKLAGILIISSVLIGSLRNTCLQMLNGSSPTSSWLSLLFLAAVLVENYLSAALYGCLALSIKGVQNTISVFWANGIKFFWRFLCIKIILASAIIISVMVALQLLGIAGGIHSVVLTGAILGALILLLAFPAYLLIVFLPAPLLLFIEDARVVVCFEKSYILTKRKMEDLVVLGFFYGLLIFLVVYAGTIYNKSSMWQIVFIEIFAGIAEIGLMGALLSLYASPDNADFQQAT